MLNKQINNEFALSKIALNNSISNIAKSGAYKLGRDSELISIVDKTKNIGYFKYYTTVFTINNEFIDKFKIYNQNKALKIYPPTGDIEFCLKIPDTKNFSAFRINKFVNNSQKSKIFISTHQLDAAGRIAMAHPKTAPGSSAATHWRHLTKKSRVNTRLKRLRRGITQPKTMR